MGPTKSASSSSHSSMPKMPFASRLATSPEAVYYQEGLAGLRSQDFRQPRGLLVEEIWSRPSPMSPRGQRPYAASSFSSRMSPGQSRRSRLEASPRTLLHQIAFDLEDTVSRALADMPRSAEHGSSDSEDDVEPPAAILESPRGSICSGCMVATTAAFEGRTSLPAAADAEKASADTWLLARRLEDEELLRTLQRDSPNGTPIVTL
eukprot:TRINITY_DN19962_c0_g1_i2.p2 TRINITY_DN19962_c0_g1~~TRINITY_DN19962_c0_g1_i2.p2  ORF type:complete len:206 (-),score=37.72 TRINITY_DN19962_c0_g1_i2:2-619(-)